MKKISRHKLDTLYKMQDDHDRQIELASELLRTAQDRDGAKEATVIRDGKEVRVSEAVLWTEVNHLGPNSEAGGILKKRHPEVFEAYGKADKLGNEMHAFAVTEFEVDYRNMKLRDYLKLIEKVIDLKIARNEAEAAPQEVTE